MRQLERLGLAHQVGPGQWTLAENAEPTLRALGERNDIIRRIHRGLAEHGWERATSSLVLTSEAQPSPVIGRAMEVRVEFLVSEGLARWQGQRVIFIRDLLNTLRRRELDTAGAKISAETGLPYHSLAEGETIAG